jgi:hypothetical protein
MRRQDSLECPLEVFSGAARSVDDIVNFQFKKDRDR